MRVMGSLFKKYGNESVSAGENRGGGHSIIPKYYLFVQQKWATKMSAMESGLSKKNLIFLLGVFIILAGGVCIYSVSRSLSHTTSSTIEIIPISKPADAFEKSFGSTRKPSSIAKNDFKKIIGFRMFLDSLARTPTGRRTYDSIARYRPGLMDSLAFIENYYKSNFKD